MSLRVDIEDDWEKARFVAGPIRHAVFFESKDPLPGIEPDELDPKCVHAIAFDEAGNAVGTGRLDPEGHIGPMAVVKEWRRRGVGDAIIDALIEEARKRRYPAVSLSAPLQAAEFYRNHGFVPDGKVVKEGGVLQQKMRKSLG
jgi:predicted GNAT family N-acyltransferase